MKSIKTFFCIFAEGCTWDEVVAACGCHSKSSPPTDEEEREFEEFKKNHGSLSNTIPIADHSWGGRDWTLKDGVSLGGVPYFEDSAFNGGWYYFREEDVDQIYVESATSGSSIQATLRDDGTWKMILSVPFEEGGEPYKGHYWNVFHEALGQKGEEVREVYRRKY